MSDERLRDLERRAAQGDVDAAVHAGRLRLRTRSPAAPTVAAWDRVIRRAGGAAWTPATLSARRLAALEADLAPLGELASRAVAFVRTGDGPEVLAELEGHGARLELKAAVSTRHGSARAVLALDEPAPAPLLLRLGVLYDACLWQGCTRQARGLPRALRWLEALCWEAAPTGPYREGTPPTTPRLSIPELEAALVLARARPWWAVRLALLVDTGEPQLPWIVMAMPGFVDGLRRHPIVIRHELDAPDEPDPRRRMRPALRREAAAVALLFDEALDPTPWGAEIIEAAVAGNTDHLRRTAAAVVRRLGPGAVERLRGRLRDASAVARANAAPLLWELGGAAERTRLEEVAASDRSEKVRGVVRRLLAAPPPEPRAGAAPSIERPADAHHADFDVAFEMLDGRTRDAAWALVAAEAAWQAPPRALLAPPASVRAHRCAEWVRDRLRPLVHLAPAHFVRICWLAGLIPGGWVELDVLLRDHERRAPRGTSLCALSAALVACGLDEDALGRLALDAAAEGRPFSCRTWDHRPEAYYSPRPAVVHHALEDVSRATGRNRDDLRRELRAVLALLEPLPPLLIEPLFELACGKSGMQDRRLARERLARLPDLRGRLTRMLDSRRPTVRAAAEGWLASLA